MRRRLPVPCRGQSAAWTAAAGFPETRPRRGRRSCNRRGESTGSPARPGGGASSRSRQARRQGRRRCRLIRLVPRVFGQPHCLMSCFCAYPCKILTHYPIAPNCGDAKDAHDLGRRARWGGCQQYLGGVGIPLESRYCRLKRLVVRPWRSDGILSLVRASRPQGVLRAFGAIVRLWPCQQPSSLSKKSPWHTALGVTARPPLPRVKPPLAMARNTGRALKRALILANAVCLDRPWASA